MDPGKLKIGISCTGLQTALDGKVTFMHVHAITHVTGLQAALVERAPLTSPALTGTPTAPTAASGAYHRTRHQRLRARHEA